jgi:hypothetical protein
MENGEMDWATKNKFAVGDIVYVYEVIPPRGRGGIVYETEVIKTNLSLKDKLDDRKHWPGQTYPNRITEQTRFSRLKLIGEPDGGVISLGALRKHGFTPPQVAYSIIEPLKSYIESLFQVALADKGNRVCEYNINAKKNPAMLQQEVDELITVILPTIRNDK